VRHGLERVDVESRVGLVENRQARLQDRHLEDLVALLLAAREPLVHGPVHEALIHLHQTRLLLDQRQEIHRVELLEPLVLARGVQARTQEVGRADARNLHRVLERQEDAFARPLFGIHVEEILAQVGDLSAGHLVRVAPGQHLRQRALSGAVGPHDGVHFPGFHGEVDPPENLPVPDFRSEVLDFQHVAISVWVRL
jgi:hypothetical protein